MAVQEVNPNKNKKILMDVYLESNSPDIFALCKTNLEDPIDSSNYIVGKGSHTPSLF